MGTAYRIQRPDTAFSISTQKKRPREHRAGHLAYIRGLSCLACPTPVFGCEAAHVRYGDMSYGKVEGSAGMKPDDRWCVPLCPTHHREQHAANEREWWQGKGIDPLRIAATLFGCSGDEEAGELVIAAARQKAAAR